MFPLAAPGLAVLGLAVLGLAACAAPPYADVGSASPASAVASQGRHCFWTRNVNGFRAQDDRTVNVRVGAGDVYQLELFAPCPDVDWAEHIALESRGGSNICTGLDATVIAPSSIGPQRCAVRNVRQLTPQEVAALPPGDRP